MSKTPLTRRQPAGQSSPWSLSRRLQALVWHAVWFLFCQWTPKPAYPWRVFVLRCFGTTVHGRPFVHQRARIQFPWNVTLHHRACVGDRTNLYSLDHITLEEGAVAAQEAYLCTGTHDFADPELPMLTAPIMVKAHAFIGARAFVLPGVTLGERSVVGAMSVVTRDVPAGTTVAGNPAKSR